MTITLRTDLDIAQLPSPIPNFGGLLGKNIIQTDPSFGTQIVRATDASTNNNSSMFTADSPESTLWNVDDTMLALRHKGGTAVLFQFDPTFLTTTKLPYSYGRVSFSSIEPGVLYVVDGTQLWELEFELVNGAWTLQTQTLLADFASILPPGFEVDWRGVFSHSDDDSTFLLAVSSGIQGTGYNVCVWQSGHDSGGYRMLNTETGAITGDWGQIGTATGYPFSKSSAVHDASMTPNPEYASVGMVTGLALWEISTLNVATAKHSAGHRAKGFLHYYTGGPGGGQYGEVPYDSPDKERLIVPDDMLPKEQDPKQTYAGDQHSAFGYVSTTDDSIFWVTSTSTVTPFTSCWMNEVRGYQATGPDSGTVYRACHTFNSGKSKEFVVLNAIGIPSQTGRFVAFSSDMMGTLGSTSGQPTGTLGVDARGDVFIVQVAE
jgi:hypothetical protein